MPVRYVNQAEHALTDIDIVHCHTDLITIWLIRKFDMMANQLLD